MPLDPAQIPGQIAEARAAGYSDGDIYAHLAKMDPRFADAQANGYSLDDIASHFAPKAAVMPMPTGNQPQEPTGSPEGIRQTPVSPGTGALNNKALNTVEDVIQSATPVGPMVGLVNEPLGGSKGQVAKTALRIGSLGLSALPGFGVLGGVEGAAGRALAGGMAGTAAGTVAADYSPVQNPLLRAALQIGGGVVGGGMGANQTLNPLKAFSTPPQPNPDMQSASFGKLSPAQAQIRSGQKGLTDEIERESLNRASNPMQELASQQADTMQGNLNKALSGVAPIQEPTTAAGNFQDAFDVARKAAGGSMQDIDQLVNSSDKLGLTKLNPTDLRANAIQAVRDAGWNVNPKGQIVPDVTAKGFSQQAAGVVQKYLDGLKNVNSVAALRNLRQNFGQEIYKAAVDSGVPSDIVKNNLYGVLNSAEQGALPAPLASKLQQANANYSGLKGLSDSDAIGKALQQDPVKFWDNLLNSARSDKDFMPTMQGLMDKAGLNPQDLQSIATSNIADKVQSALNNPAKDNIGRLSQGISALEKEVNRIPFNSRESLLGDAYPQIQQMIQDGRVIRDWANRLPNGSNTAVNMAPQLLSRLGDWAENIGSASHLPFGRTIGGGIGALLRKGGSLQNDLAMKSYLQNASQLPTPLSQRLLPLLGITPALGASNGQPNQY